MTIARITVTQPYEPNVSVNHAYNRGSPRQGHKKEVDAWLMFFKVDLIAATNPFGPPTSVVQMNIRLFMPRQKGRRADTSNFRKLPQDIAALVFGIDDSHFGGTDMPCERVTGAPGDEPRIEFEFIWQYDPTQPWGRQNNRMPIRPDSGLHYGPLAKTDMWRQLGLTPGQICIGYGSLYCMQCKDCPTNTCPVQFTPEVYAEQNCPCRDCEEACPCKVNPPGRQQKIKAWWERHCTTISRNRKIRDTLEDSWRVK